VIWKRLEFLPRSCSSGRKEPGHDETNNMDNIQNLRRNSTQNTAEKNRHRSQVWAIVGLLRSRCGQWVPLPEVMSAGGTQYNARIHFARHTLGIQIENLTQHIDGDRRSWFRLIEPNHPPCQTRKKIPVASPSSPSPQETLFSRFDGGQ
jgi:hypothetical protein